MLLDVRNSQNESVKTITCPQCKAQLRVMFSKQPMAPMPCGETQYVRHDNSETRYVDRISADNEETVYAGKKETVAQPGYLSFKGQQYLLSFGDNIIGRRASTSKATIQIATEDRYMSRQHLVISVVKISAEKIRVIVSNYHNKNASYIDGQLLNEGDQLILSNGSVIKMGNTTVTYHQK